MFGRFRRNEDVVGFALSGGGARGATQVGSVRALLEAGIVPNLLAGTSAGAVNAGFFAMYPDRIDRLEEIWLSLRRKDIFPGTRFQVLGNLIRHGYVHRAHTLERFLRSHLQDARFEDTAIPCAIVAVRLSDGERVVFESGEIVPAVLASTAIPGVFPPYRIGDEEYVDGGVVEYMPVPSLIERNASTIYALDCSGYANGPVKGLAVMDRCALISSTYSARQVASLSGARGRSVYHIRPILPSLADARDFSQTCELITLGYEYTRDYLRDQVAERASGRGKSSTTAS